MPAKNRIKQYLSDGHYHLYNRGTEKRIIFLDQQDYSVFLSYLKDYLLPKDELLTQKIRGLSSPLPTQEMIKLLRLNNFNGEITLLAYCLMPNHFHLFVKQKSPWSVDKFMNSLCTRYTMYFNKKYKRVGSLYQGVYKAVLVDNENYYLYLTKYIHNQALPNQPSSYLNYLGRIEQSWVNPAEILSYFSKTNSQLSYEALVSLSGNNNTLPSQLLLEEEESLANIKARP